jgi:hypothetical protein
MLFKVGLSCTFGVLSGESRVSPRGMRMVGGFFVLTGFVVPKTRAPRKYQPEKLIAMLRLAAKLRNEMLAEKFTDNGGAIHSAERILNILGLTLKYPALSHINNLRHLENAVFSAAALASHQKKQQVFIEHVSPLRYHTRETIKQIDAGVSDAEIAAFIREHFKLVLLTADEAMVLNRKNRSKIDPDRLAGISFVLGDGSPLQD